MGFHAPQEAARILGEAIDYAWQGNVAATAWRVRQNDTEQLWQARGVAQNRVFRSPRICFRLRLLGRECDIAKRQRRNVQADACFSDSEERLCGSNKTSDKITCHSLCTGFSALSQSKAGLYTNYRLLLDSAYIIGEMNVYLGLISADTSDPQSGPEEEEQKGK